MEYERVLVPTDGSETARRAAEHAVDLAAQYGGTVHALYVVDSAAYAIPEFDGGAVLTALEEAGEEAVEAVADLAASAGVPAETSVVHGTPHRDIVEYAEDNGMDLVVMGTHGRRGLKRYLLGSVAERVVRTCPVPVLTVRAAGGGDGTDAAGDA